MTSKAKKPPSKAMQRWDTEGGAAENGPQQEPRRKRPRDANQLAKSIVDIATGDVSDVVELLEEGERANGSMDKNTSGP
jgi:hypothetical protein